MEPVKIDSLEAQAATPPVGVVEVRKLPPVSTTTQSEIDGHDTPVAS
jgi:hypothetical protein